MNANTAVPAVQHGGFDVPMPRRLRGVVHYAHRLGLAGTDHADAIDAIEEAIWGRGLLPLDRSSQRRAWGLVRERAMEAYLREPRAIETAEMRAYHAAPALLGRLGEGATFIEFVELIRSSEPLLGKRRAIGIAQRAIDRAALAPIRQRAPHPDNIWGTVIAEPCASAIARHRRALSMKLVMASSADSTARAESDSNAELNSAYAVAPASLSSADRHPAVRAKPVPPRAFDIDKEPGLLGDLARWSLSYAFRPNPDFAQLSAIATLSPIFGRRFATPTGLGLNLYLVGLATTGSGKEALIGAPPAALEAAGLGFLIGAGDFTSDSALEVALRARPNFLAPIDEVGEFVGAAQQRNAAAFSRTIRKALLELHSKSRPDGRWSGKQKANAEFDKAADPIFAPSLSILGASTGTGFFESLTEANLADGFINRLVVVEGGKAGQRNLDPARMTVPAELIEALKAAYGSNPGGNLVDGRARTATTKPSMAVVPWADGDAQRAWSRITDWEDEATDAGRAGITGRAAANTLVVATIRALARDASAAAVTADDVAWAWEFVGASIATIERGARENMAGSDFEQLVKAIQAAVIKAGPGGLPRSKLLTARGISKHTPQMVDAALKRLEETEVTFRDIGSSGGRPKSRITARCFAGA